MAKVAINTNTCLYPMPMTIVGAMVDDKPNFMAVAWITRVSFDPPMLGIALGKTHYTNRGILMNREFSVNIPGEDLVVETDYVGIATGNKTSKAEVFETFFGELKSAPMIQACPLCIECRLTDAVDLPSNTFFIGEITGVHAEESILDGQNPDIRKMAPFTLTMPDNGYWKVGEYIAKAWSIGREYKEK